MSIAVTRFSIFFEICSKSFVAIKKREKKKIGMRIDKNKTIKMYSFLILIIACKNVIFHKFVDDR